MSSIYDWSQTAADNDDADSIINWAEGQDPSTVNNSARAMMKRVAERIADQGPVTAGGTADALTLTTNSAFTALANGLQITLKAASANTGAATLNVNALGAKAIRKVTRDGEGALAAGDLQASGVYDLRYDASANSAAGAWILLNPTLYGAGTWTPTVTFGTPGDLSVAYTTQQGAYRRIGDLVILSMNINTSTFTHSTAVGNLRIEGLPFTVGSGTAEANFFGSSVTDATNTEWKTTPNAGGTHCTLQRGQDSGITTANVTDFLSGDTFILRGTIIYIAA